MNLEPEIAIALICGVMVLLFLIAGVVIWVNKRRVKKRTSAPFMGISAESKFSGDLALRLREKEENFDRDK